MDYVKLDRINLKIKEHLSNCSKNIELYLSFLEKNKIKDMNKKLDYLKRELDSIQKLIFDPKILSEAIYEQIVELELIKIFVSYCALQEDSLIILFFPYIQVYLFPNEFIGKQKNDDLYELLLMNSSTLNSIKILNSTLIKIFKKPQVPEIIVEYSINFINQLLKKFVIFPNFYFSISSANTSDSNINFDAELFELVVEIFSKEFFLIHRDTRSKLRKCILLCLNLENFYSINKQYIYNLFNYFIDNLIRYYHNYKSFDIKNMNKPLKKENVSNEDFEEIFKLDVISYLKFMDIFIRCLEDSNLKFFMKAKIFSKFLIEYIQKDLTNFQKFFNPFLEKKLEKVMEFLYFICKYLTNSTISELMFNFIFGFDNLNKESKISEEIYENDYLDYDKSVLITCAQDQTVMDDLDFNRIRTNLKKLEQKQNIEKDLSLFNSTNAFTNNKKNQSLLINNYNQNLNEDINSDNNSENFKENKFCQLDLSYYDNELILGFFIRVLKSETSEEKRNFKIILLNILTKIIKNSSGLFLIEVLVPYYINYIHLNSPKFFDGFIEKLEKYNERFILSEIINILLPKQYAMNFNEWENYFNCASQNNYLRNCELLEKESILNEKNLNENLDNIKSNLFNDNSIDLNITMTRKNVLSDSNDFNFLENENILDLNNTQNKFSCFLTVNDSKIIFYEALLSYFKRFTTNHYTENLFLTELFLEIFSVPLISNLGENGNKLYNIYCNVTYYTIKNNFLFNISAVGILSSIGSEIDEFVRFNFDIDEMNNQNIFELKIERMSKTANLKKTLKNDNTKNSNLIDFCYNAKLLNETFKEFISNLYCKRYFDMINLNNLNQGNE